DLALVSTSSLSSNLALASFVSIDSTVDDAASTLTVIGTKALVSVPLQHYNHLTSSLCSSWSGTNVGGAISSSLALFTR
ncbi:unnamed protein product, partial [Ilex paraguariensis]